MSAVQPVPVGCLSICVVQIERQVSHCCCAKRYQVSKVAEGKYRVSGEGRVGEARERGGGRGRRGRQGKEGEGGEGGECKEFSGIELESSCVRAYMRVPTVETFTGRRPAFQLIGKPSKQSRGCQVSQGIRFHK